MAEATAVAHVGMMGFGRAIATCFRKYVNFNGRARRAEYWWWELFWWLVVFALVFVDQAIEPPDTFALGMIAILALFLPTLAVSVRRLHDAGLSGYLIFVKFIPIPFVGTIIFLVLMCQAGTRGSNQFGPDPLAPDVAATFD